MASFSSLSCRSALSLLSLLLLLQLSLVAAAACPANFTLQHGFCLHSRPHLTGPRLNWCNAQAFCNSIGGKLLSTVSSLIALQPVMSPLNRTERYLLGFTDMLKESGTSRSGWLSTDDGELPVNSVTDAMWGSNKPDNNHVPDDCLMIYSDNWGPFKLTDSVCSNNYGFICEPGPQSYSKASSIFDKSALPSSQPLQTAPFYCRGEEVTAKSRLHCIYLCAENPVCKAALFNKASLACRQILHGDTAVEAAIETDANWEKFVR